LLFELPSVGALVPNPWGRINLLFELPSVGALLLNYPRSGLWRSVGALGLGRGSP
jgi:hypothetical protein